MKYIYPQRTVCAICAHEPHENKAGPAWTPIDYDPLRDGPRVRQPWACPDCAEHLGEVPSCSVCGEKAVQTHANRWHPTRRWRGCVWHRKESGGDWYLVARYPHFPSCRAI